MIDLGEWGRIFGPEQLAQIHEDYLARRAGRLAQDPAMRAIVGREGMDRPAASTSQVGRFETEWLATEADLASHHSAATAYAVCARSQSVM